MSKYRTSWTEIQEQMNEFALSHTVRYRDPLNKKRFAVPFKSAEKAKAKMDQLKRDGVKEIEITKDILRGKFKEETDHEVSMARGELEAISDKALELSSALEGMSDEGNPLEAWVQSKITKAKDYINSVSDYLLYNPDIKMNEEIRSEDDYQAKKKALQDIQNNPKMNDPETKDALVKRKEKLDKEYAEFKSKKEAVDNPYAVGMAQAMKQKNDEPPLKKSTITKAHDIAKSIMKKEETTDSEKMAKMRVRQMALQTKLKDLDVGDPKNKTPIAITKNDLENIQMKMDQLKNKREEVHPAKSLIEKIEAVKNKAEKSGMPYSILKKVYDRGMAAWKGGHRPGTTPQQWALARVNSFVTKSSGTWGGADSDLAKKVRSKD